MDHEQQSDVSSVSPQTFDFRTEPVEQMDLPTVEMHLSNVYSGDLRHPYFNSRDGRKEQAMAFVSALHARKVALTPAGKDPTLTALAENQAERKQKAQGLQQRLHALSGETFDLPAEVDEVHLNILQRDAQILEGDFSNALFELKRAARLARMDTEPGVEAVIRSIDEMLYRGVDWQNNPPMRQVLSDSLLSLQRLVSQREIDRWNAAKATVKERTAAESARKLEGLKAIQAAQQDALGGGYGRSRG